MTSLNQVADAGDFDLATLTINGGHNGEAERNACLVASKKALAA